VRQDHQGHETASAVGLDAEDPDKEVDRGAAVAVGAAEARVRRDAGEEPAQASGDAGAAAILQRDQDAEVPPDGRRAGQQAAVDPVGYHLAADHRDQRGASAAANAAVARMAHQDGQHPDRGSSLDAVHREQHCQGAADGGQEPAPDGPRWAGHRVKERRAKGGPAAVRGDPELEGLQVRQVQVRQVPLWCAPSEQQALTRQEYREVSPRGARKGRPA